MYICLGEFVVFFGDIGIGWLFCWVVGWLCFFGLCWFLVGFGGCCSLFVLGLVFGWLLFFGGCVFGCSDWRWKVWVFVIGFVLLFCFLLVSWRIVCCWYSCDRLMVRCWWLLCWLCFGMLGWWRDWDRCCWLCLVVVFVWCWLVVSWLGFVWWCCLGLFWFWVRRGLLLSRGIVCVGWVIRFCFGVGCFCSMVGWILVVWFVIFVCCWCCFCGVNGCRFVLFVFFVDFVCLVLLFFFGVV